MRHICVLIVLVCLSIASDAQVTGSSGFHEVKVYGGYQFTQLDTHATQDEINLQHALDPTFPLLNFGNHQNLSGWNFGVEEDTYTKWFGIVADVGEATPLITLILAPLELFHYMRVLGCKCTPLPWVPSLPCV
jgi:hypothetical protein